MWNCHDGGVGQTYSQHSSIPTLYMEIYLEFRYLFFTLTTQEDRDLTPEPSCKHKQQNHLLRISKRAVRCIFEHDTFTRTSYLLERYHIISLEKRYHTKSIFFVFRCIHNICSSLLSEMFSLRRDGAHTDRVTRGQVNYSLSLSIVQAQAGYKSISFLGADRFNALPESLRTNHIPNSFRQELNKFIHLGHPVRRP